MLKPQEAVEFISRCSQDADTIVYGHGLEYYPEATYNMERAEGWYYTVTTYHNESGSVSKKEWFAYPSEIESCLSNYAEDDRIDDMFVENDDLFVSVNHGNVDSRTILERLGLGKFAKFAAAH